MLPSPLRLSSQSSVNFPASKFAFLLTLFAIFAVFAPGASAQSQPSELGVNTPRAGATISKTTVFRAQLPENIAQRQARVEVWVANKRVALDHTKPYSSKVDTTSMADGNYTFRVKAVVSLRGANGAARHKMYSKLVSVRVQNSKRTPVGNVKPTPTPAVTAPVPPATPAPEIASIIGPNSEWAMKFDDEFNGSSLDTTKWSTQRDDWIQGDMPYNNQEGAYYNPANNAVTNGSLVQTIRKEPSHGNAYTTGSVNSNKRFGFTYGYVESRMKVPACSGCWPAYWMLPSQAGWPPEIDIFEFFSSSNDGHAYFASHWKGATTDQEYVTNWASNDVLTENWHTYGMLWTAESIQIYIDGVAGPKYTGSAVPHQAMYLILTLQQWNRYTDTPDGVNMQTDYVRVYQHQGA